VTLREKIVPAPLASVALFVMWLALARSISLGQILLGIALAFAVPMLTAKLRTKVRVRRPLVIVGFILKVGYDVVRSNFAVAWGVIAWRWRRPQAKFVIIPLDLRDPVGLAALAMVTTVVPGTVWSQLALDRSAMILHVWDVDEEAAFVAHFKARYERPLQEIFE
jgi:multicomponent K+:H+ antiporter subunit E